MRFGFFVVVVLILVFVLLKERAGSVFIADYTEHGPVPSPRQLFKSTQSCSHIDFPTSVKSVSEKTGSNKILAEHFSFTGHMHNAISIKEKKKIITTFMDKIKWIFRKASLKDGTPKRTNILAGPVAIRQQVMVLN